MRIVLAFLLFLICEETIAQQPIRNQFTTNQAMNVVSDGWASVWNDTAKMWSNANISGLGGDAGGTNSRIANLNGRGTNTLISGLNVIGTGIQANQVVATNGVEVLNGAVSSSDGTSGFLLLDAFNREIDFNYPNLQVTFNGNQIINFTTNITSVASNLTVNGTNDARWLKLSGGVPAGSILRTDSNTNIVNATIGSGLSFDGTTLSATSAGTPGGSTLQIQYNTNNTFGADASFYYNVVTNELVVSNNFSGGAKLSLIGGSGREFSFKVEDGTNRITSPKHLLFELGAIGTYTMKSNNFSPPQNNSTGLGADGTQFINIFVGSIGQNATNGVEIVTSVANSNSVPITNIIGLVEQASATPLFWDANLCQRYSVTNRVSAAITIVITNTAQGQEVKGKLIGEASGGANRVITVVPQLGHLVANLDTFGTALATSASFTLTNGNSVEFSWLVDKQNGTNVAAFVSRQYAF